ncbi:hypothetical protein [Clostridium sp. DJ247]|uniref:hypothetical protein n=1 Tax=Clostridium sp. DJ247 TaxID=2726188 RepID=UPI00162449FF|nr:hypothetical protein [Clostridium sp. DJ247]MBC2581737.1 hypothetical protein [Clostridium sp. DJ247]
MFFRIPKELFNYRDKVYILQTKHADVNGDGLDERLILTGKNVKLVQNKRHIIYYK